MYVEKRTKERDISESNRFKENPFNKLSLENPTFNFKDLDQPERGCSLLTNEALMFAHRLALDPKSYLRSLYAHRIQRSRVGW